MELPELPELPAESAEVGRNDDNVETGDEKNMSLTAEIECEITKLKGDAIGDTLYSERWVLSQLMDLLKCSSGELSSKAEEELCLLWDMTVGEDVIKCLLKHDFLTIATQCLKPSTPARAVEIIVGILGNLCRTVEARRELALHRGLQGALFDLLSSTDPHILLQLMRLLSTCIWHIDKEDDSALNDGMRSWFLSNTGMLNQQLSFILSSSLNGDLLCCTLELVHNLCCVSHGDELLSSQFATSAMLTGLFEAASQLISGLERDDEMKPIWTKEVEKALEHWATILDLFVLSESGVSLLSYSSDEFVNALVGVLSALGESESPKVLSRHKWQLLGSVANTLRCLGEHNGLAPLAVLPHILRLLPRLPKLSNEALRVPSFDDDDDDEVYEEDKDNLIDVRMNIVNYCIVILSGLSAEDLYEASSQNPTINFVELQQLLQNSLYEGFQKIAKLLSNANLTGS